MRQNPEELGGRPRNARAERYLEKMTRALPNMRLSNENRLYAAVDCGGGGGAARKTIVFTTAAGGGVNCRPHHFNPSLLIQDAGGEEDVV